MTGFGQTTLTGLIMKSTEDAVLFLLEGDEKWIPRSVCIDGDTLEDGDEDVIVANWWLEKEGLK